MKIDMTLISRIKSNISRIYHIKRYRWEVWSAYVLSAIITFLAILVDSLPYREVERCDSFRPRFGESQCFFSGKIVYYIWHTYKIKKKNYIPVYV